MDREVYWKLTKKSCEKDAVEKSVVYLAEHLGKFLRRRERVMICFPEHREGNLGWLMEQAVLRCDAIPVIWGPDHTWKTLLRQTFSYKASAIIGPPLILLGLTKLKKHQATPLFIRKVVTAGYPCPDWMIDGIAKGFDCEVGGCFAFENSSIVAGFACGHSWGIHLREEVYGVDIVDREGQILPPGELGEIVLYSQGDPSLRYFVGERAIMLTEPCKCGSTSPRLTQMSLGRNTDSDLHILGQQLQSWTSILDCKLEKGESGLEIEIICFQGEKLPKLPTAAKLVIRPWDPNRDEPFPYMPSRKDLEI